MKNKKSFWRKLMKKKMIAEILWRGIISNIWKDLWSMKKMLLKWWCHLILTLIMWNQLIYRINEVNLIYHIKIFQNNHLICKKLFHFKISNLGTFIKKYKKTKIYWIRELYLLKIFKWIKMQILMTSLTCYLLH